jgi:hypothetical protein
MPERDYPATLRVRCGQAAYNAMVGDTVASLLPWDRLGAAAKERYIRAGVAVMDEAKAAGAPARQPTLL